MDLAQIALKYGHELLKNRLTPPLLPQQKKALKAIIECRTPECGQMAVLCPDCGLIQTRYHSCGNRHCPKCQNHDTSKWLQRQKKKLLPVDYFLVTFTIPAQLRQLFWMNQKQLYKLLFDTSSSTLKEIAADPKYLGGEIGMTGVLHTHSRRLGFHPHIHYIVPAGALLSKKKLWKQSSSKYLAPEKKLNRLFRGKLLSHLKELKHSFSKKLYKIDWVVDSQSAGRGEGALKYLARYLYRGVIAEKNILSDINGQITFAYIEGDTNERKTRTLAGADFLRLVLQHVLPKGFRRSRDYGFLHGNSKKTFRLLQLILHPKNNTDVEVSRATFTCPNCKEPMIILFTRYGYRSFEHNIRGSPRLKTA